MEQINMRKYTMRKSSAALLAVLLAGCLVACGKKTTNTDAGMEAISAQNYEQARTCFDKAILEGEDLQLAYRGQGLAYMGQTDYESAIESFDRALQNGGMFVSDREVDINYYLATAQYKNGQLSDAIQTLDAIAGVRKGQDMVYYLRGSIKMENGDYDGAVKDLNEALSKSKNNIPMTIRVYETFADNGHEQEGQSYLSSAIENRLDAMTDYEKGVVYYYSKDYENARNFLELAKSGAKETGSDTLLMLGKTYEQLGDSNYAASLYEKYLAENDADPVIYNQLGLCKLETEDYEAALTAINSGLSVTENNSVTQELRFNQIVAYEHLGNFKTAAALMNSYLDSYPDDAAAIRENEFLKTR